MPALCVIFDVDGTLVDSNAFNDELYGRAVTDVLGNVRLRPDWSRYEHKTDTGILREICRENALDARAPELNVRKRFGELVGDHLQRSGACPPIPGGPALLDSLRNYPGVHVGIATGGWPHTALMKLHAAGYDTSGLVLASADDAYERTEILEIARTRLAPAAAAMYVGDGEWDRRACESLGWPFIGVGDRLRGQCKHWMPDLLSDQVIGALLGRAS